MNKDKKDKKDKKSKKPDGIVVSKEFEFTLTPEEKNVIADRGSSLHINVNVTKQAFKELKSEWSARIRSLEAQHTETQTCINSGKELRTVDAILVKDYNHKEITYWYEVDGEWTKIDSRTMTTEETQMEMGEAKGIARAAKQKINKDDESQTMQEGIADVISMETNRKTKVSAVDPIEF